VNRQEEGGEKGQRENKGNEKLISFPLKKKEIVCFFNVPVNAFPAQFSFSLRKYE